MPLRLALATIATALALTMSARAAPPERLEFTRMLAHWDGYSDPGYLSFIDAAQPEVVQVGFYGAHFWSLAHTEAGGGYPAHFPLVGLDNCGAWFRRLNGDLHQRGVKVVGHFNVTMLVGDPDGPDGPRGFFKFYRDLWNESELGPRPVQDPLQMVEKNLDGTPMAQAGYGIGGMRQYRACLNNPAWRQVLKAWTKVALARGVDGLIANYFYRHNCMCAHCQGGFKKHLEERFTRRELRDQLGIADLAAHKFSEIVAWHDPSQSSPLRREMLRYSQISGKRALDEVLIEYGRSLKPDLIVAQWDHLGQFDEIRGDERCMLPAELWGRGEDYLWYSTGGTACFTDLAAGFLGEGTLHARYIRGAFDDKPFTLGKYEQTRTRVAIAELAAGGGAPLGFYARFQDPQARAEIVRYFQFLKRFEKLFRANRSHAEALLLFPRSRVHEGDVGAVEQFKKIGQKLLDEHVLFDILPDDIATAQRLKAYRLVVRATNADPAAIEQSSLSRFRAPQTVRVSASRPNGLAELNLHLVNYNRVEPSEPRSPGGGIADERPIAVKDIEIDLRLPAEFKVGRVSMVTPEAPEPVTLNHQVSQGRLRVQVPQFLVYAMLRVEESSDR